MYSESFISKNFDMFFCNIHTVKEVSKLLGVKFFANCVTLKV